MSPEPWPPLPPPAPAPDGGLVGRLALMAAGLALVAYLVGGILLVVPVEVPEVQRCGAPGAYLLDGRVDVVPTDDDRILGPDGDPVTLDADVAAAARAQPCQARVADRALPAAILVGAATVVGTVALGVEVLVVRRRQRAALAPPPPPPYPTG